MKEGKVKPASISELKPRRLYSSELAEKGRIVVLVPQQKNVIVEWLSGKKNRASDRIKLDLLGSFVWNSCDGKKTVQQIADKMKQEYGKYAEPVDKNVYDYINQLHSNNLIEVGK